jgi:hypothetical protein
MISAAKRGCESFVNRMAQFLLVHLRDEYLDKAETFCIARPIHLARHGEVQYR